MSEPRSVPEANGNYGTTPSPQGSTLSSAAHAAGVPAIAIGVTIGGGEHTPTKWIDTSPLGAGLGRAAATIAGWEGGDSDRP